MFIFSFVCLCVMYIYRSASDFLCQSFFFVSMYLTFIHLSIWMSYFIRLSVPLIISLTFTLFGSLLCLCASHVNPFICLLVCVCVLFLFPSLSHTFSNKFAFRSLLCLFVSHIHPFMCASISLPLSASPPPYLSFFVRRSLESRAAA